jgi:hypothetical protein
MHDVRYYYYYGVFYTMTPTNEYEVVLPPVGAIVESIPEGYEKLEIDGNIITSLMVFNTRPLFITEKSGMRS